VVTAAELNHDTARRAEERDPTFDDEAGSIAWNAGRDPRGMHFERCTTRARNGTPANKLGTAPTAQSRTRDRTWGGAETRSPINLTARSGRARHVLPEQGMG